MDATAVKTTTRRSLITGAAAACAASILGTLRPGGVSAHDVDDVLLGGANASATTTSIANSSNGNTVLSVSGNGVAIAATSPGVAISATSPSSAAVMASSTSGTGVFASSSSGPGTHGKSTGSYGVVGESESVVRPAILGFAAVTAGVYGYCGGAIFDTQPPTWGTSGVFGYANVDVNSAGVRGQSMYGGGIDGLSVEGYGVRGRSSGGPGVHGTSVGDNVGGVQGVSTGNGAGVIGVSGGLGTVALNAGHVGVYGYANQSLSVGVFGQSGHGYGIEALSVERPGLLAHSQAPTSPGALAVSETGSTGLLGFSGPLGTEPSASPKTGVYGYAAQDATSRGVLGKTTVGQAVRGEAAGGIGVRGYATGATGIAGLFTASGVALKVEGRATFTRSGKASVAANALSADVTVPGGIAATASIMATMQTYVAGVSIAAVRANYPSTGMARIYLTKVASTTAATSVGWFVVG